MSNFKLKKMSSSAGACNLQKLVQYSQKPNSFNYSPTVSMPNNFFDTNPTTSGWISTMPMPTRHGSQNHHQSNSNIDISSPSPTFLPGYADPLKQGNEWNPLRNQQVQGADCFTERVHWKKKMSDPRKAWHARESLARQNMATNRMRLGPNTRVIECGDPGNCIPAHHPVQPHHPVNPHQPHHPASHANPHHPVQPHHPSHLNPHK